MTFGPTRILRAHQSDMTSRLDIMSSRLYAALMKLANTVREHRVAGRLTQDELAKATGVSRQTIVAIEKGEYTPSALLALKLGQAFRVPVEELFRIED
jgi:putative transcriptional regulator